MGMMAIVILLLLGGYFGGYNANCMGYAVSHDYLQSDSGPPTVDLFEIGAMYRVAQKSSESIIWPADWIDRKLRPIRTGLPLEKSI